MLGRVRILSAVALVTLLPAATLAAANYFPRNLERGDDGRDVYNLQVVLNRGTSTKVAADGPGSPGQETQHFGFATEDAVKRFQQAHAATTLAPAGLDAPTGFVGPLTRKALSLAAKVFFGEWDAPASAAPAAATAPATSTAVAGTISPLVRRGVFSGAHAGNSTAPIVFPAESVGVRAGGDATLIGYQFVTGAKYDVMDAGSGKKIAVARATTTNAVSFSVPTTLRSGTYQLFFVAADGSQTNAVPVYVSSDQGPRITQVSPSPITYGAKVTIQGDGFTDAGNRVVTPLGTVENLKSVRGTIEFVNDFSHAYPEEVRRNVDMNLRSTLRVENAKGVSDPVTIYVAI